MWHKHAILLCSIQIGRFLQRAARARCIVDTIGTIKIQSDPLRKLGPLMIGHNAIQDCRGIRSVNVTEIEMKQLTRKLVLSVTLVVAFSANCIAMLVSEMAR